MDSQLYFPEAVFGQDNQHSTQSRVFTSPGKYIQGPGVLGKVGRYLSILKVSQVGILASNRGHRDQVPVMTGGLMAHDITWFNATFGGECSIEEINAHALALSEQNIQLLMVLGGGKCVDAGKCIAHRLGIPVVIIPTLASNDAPCSALSVIYSPVGVAVGVEFFPSNPVMVIVDTEVVVSASERYLVAGMGDAMATWYEAKVCSANPDATNTLGTRPTLAACAMGEICAHTLYADSLDAIASVRAGETAEPLERVVEANTLLSGLGFESGGLAAAHGVAQGLTQLPVVEENYLHGEMVGLGLLAQLALLNDDAEARKATEYCARVGLPVQLQQLSLDRNDPASINLLVDATMTFGPLANLPFTVTGTLMREAILKADALGTRILENLGDTAYRSLHRSS